MSFMWLGLMKATYIKDDGFVMYVVPRSRHMQAWTSSQLFLRSRCLQLHVFVRRIDVAVHVRTVNVSIQLSIISLRLCRLAAHVGFVTNEVTVVDAQCYVTGQHL